jgi:hypothetical protein
MDDLLLTGLTTLNEILSAAIVVVAVSMLLYNLTRNVNNRVARTSAAVLACVTISYVADVFTSLRPDAMTALTVQRLQWLGIAFIPAAIFHLSDALLATTGLPSRGRRRRAVRLLYIVATVFFLLAVFTDAIVYPVPIEDGYFGLRAAPGFLIYLIYFVIATVIGFINVNRARQRCQTRSTKRRMAYLQAALLTPLLGIFPFSAFFAASGENSVWALTLVNLANIFVILMLSFLAYPLSFFGSSIPDRAVKADLLRFMLRGPVTGLLILATIIFTSRATAIFSLSGDSFMPFAVVAVVLFWQWMVDLALPHLDRWLIYNEEDDSQLAKIQSLSRSLLTHDDLVQLLEAVLQATCDYLRVDNAFIASIYNGDQEIIHQTGASDIRIEQLRYEIEPLRRMFADGTLAPQRWDGYWVFGLYSKRKTKADGSPPLIGLMSVEAQDDIDPRERDHDGLLAKLVSQAARSLDDLVLQGEIFAVLEGLLPQFATTRQRAVDVEYKPGYPAATTANTVLPFDRSQIIEQVQAALRHYYGGPGMSQSRLLELRVVRDAFSANDNNPVKALRAVLDQAIENQRPAGDPDLRSQEWLLYNILEMRFLKKRKVREIAERLYMSEANLYRKQSLAIEAVSDALIKMELDSTNGRS